MKNVVKTMLIAVLALSLVGSEADAKTKKLSKTAWLGVITQTVDSELSESFELKTDRGAIINEVVEDSPAEEAGLQEDDIIISFDGRQVDDANDLIRYVRKSEPNSGVSLEIIRDGDEMTIDVTLGKRNNSRSYSYSFSNLDKPLSIAMEYLSESGGYLGVELIGLSEQLGDYFGAPEGVGVLISSVSEDSPAKEAGLKAGDLIVSIDDEEVEGISDVQQAIREKEEGEEVSLTVLRDRSRKSFTVAVGEQEIDDSRSFRMPDMPSFQSFPKMRGLYWSGGAPDADMTLESDDIKADIRELREELNDLKKEIKRLKRSKP